MSDFEVFDDVTVKLINHMGTDGSIVQAARVSTIGENDPNFLEALKGSDVGLVNYLMREKHGSPFEHTSMTFYVKAPIFVFREFMRHRMASYNEMSGRYMKLPGEFYIPRWDRPLINAGTSSKPEMVPGVDSQYLGMERDLFEVYELAWFKYNKMLDAGIANEVARIVLPVGLYSQMYVTMNLRGLFNFLSLRTQRENAVHISRPQREIEMVAEEMEGIASTLFPVAFEAFERHGRVAP